MRTGLATTAPVRKTTGGECAMAKRQAEQGVVGGQRRRISEGGIRRETAPPEACPRHAGHRSVSDERGGEHLLAERTADARLLHVPVPRGAGEGRGVPHASRAGDAQRTRELVPLPHRRIRGRCESGRCGGRDCRGPGIQGPADRDRSQRLVPHREPVRPVAGNGSGASRTAAGWSRGCAASRVRESLPQSAPQRARTTPA